MTVDESAHVDFCLKVIDFKGHKPRQRDAEASLHHGLDITGTSHSGLSQNGIAQVGQSPRNSISTSRCFLPVSFGMCR